MWVEQDYMQRLGEYRLEAQHNPAPQEVVITGRGVAVRHLLDVMCCLIEAGKPGSDEHPDRVSGLEGNVSSLLIGKKGEL